MKFCACLLTLGMWTVPLASHTIAEKKEALRNPQSQLQVTPQSLINDELVSMKKQLKALYLQTQDALSSSQELDHLVKQVQQLRSAISEKEEQFKQLKFAPSEATCIMHEKEIHLEQLIYEYASDEHLYIIPPEMSKIQISLCSNLDIPTASRQEVIELICHQNGIGIKQENNFVRSLYWTIGNHSPTLNTITQSTAELKLLAPHERVCHLLKMTSLELQPTMQFLKNFTNARSTFVQSIHNTLVIIGEAQEVLEINKLIQFVSQHKENQSYRLLPLDKLKSEEMQAAIKTYFNLNAKEEKGQPLQMLKMKKHLLVMGSEPDLNKASFLAKELNEQMVSPEELSVHWYTCKFSEPSELANLLQQVYEMMTHNLQDDEIDQQIQQMTTPKSVPCVNRSGTIPPVCETAPKLVVNPPQAQPRRNPTSETEGSTFPNFIVDGKSGMIVMVVRQNLLQKLIELAKKVDVPKKMVQIEVLLFEKKINDQTQFGLNLFQLGDQSKSTNAGVNWSVDTQNRNSPGILDYFFGRSKKQGVFPAFNFAYNFLISQDDIYVHSNPTITTVNQTPAVIDLIEEQSLNMGTVEDPRTSTISNTFVRAQYGTFIQITPTVNTNDEEDDQTFITLDTNITFDTTTSSVDDRPNVNRRHIQNQVRIPSGETLILGGLRRKNTEDHVDKIPFLGDIPGLGKFFSYTSLNDKSTEMFIFITPKVVEDAVTHFEKYKQQNLKRRPGDSPELLKKIFEAKALEKQKQYRMSLKQLFNHG